MKALRHFTSLSLLILLLFNMTEALGQCRLEVNTSDSKCPDPGSGTAVVFPVDVPGLVCNAASPVQSCVSCSQILSGNGNYNIGIGQKGCITGSFTGTVNINGGVLTICGNATPQNLNFNNGEVHVLPGGELDITSLSINSNCRFYNFGTVRTNTLTAPGGTAENHGNMLIRQGYNSNGSAALSNFCTMEVLGDFIVDNLFTNRGKLVIHGLSRINGSGNVSIFSHSEWHTNDLLINGQITGDTGPCPLVAVAGTTEINSAGRLNGFVTLCDPDGIEMNNGIISPDVTLGCGRCFPGSEQYTCDFLWEILDSEGNTAGILASTGPVATQLPPGTYRVTAQCADCGELTPQVFSIGTTTSNPMQVSVDTVAPVNGQCDGQATAVVQGGAQPYTFNWSTGHTSAQITGLCQDSLYVLRVADTNGCAQHETVFFPGNDDPSSCQGFRVNVASSCIGGGSGIISFPDNITDSCSYVLLDPLTGIATHTEAASFDSLPAGIYRLYRSCESCLRDTLITIRESSSYCDEISCGDDNFGRVVTEQHATTCALDGQVSVHLCDTASAENHLYIWTRNGEEISRGGRTVFNLGSGIYRLRILDRESGNLLFSRATLVEELPCDSTTGDDCSAFSLQITDLNHPRPDECNGSIEATASGAVAEVTYQWFFENSLLSNRGNLLFSSCAGTYSIIASDGTCSDTLALTLEAGPCTDCPDICDDYTAGSGSVRNVSCHGANDGAAYISVSGGTGDYSAVWVAGSGESFGGLSRNDLGPDTYQVTVTDQVCGPVTFPVTITEPPAIDITLSQSQPYLCRGGSVTLSVNDPQAGWHYRWSHNPALAASSAVFTEPGRYHVIVSNGSCEGVSAQVRLDAEPDEVRIRAHGTEVCPDDNLGVTLTSSTGSFIRWSTPSMPELDGSQRRAIDVLQPGEYILIVQYEGCAERSDTVSITRLDECPRPKLTCTRPDFPEITVDNPCEQLQLIKATTDARLQYSVYRERIRRNFQSSYIEHCLSRTSEGFGMRYNDYGEYHYTLYYYDQAGNLVRTVPPKGVTKLTDISEVPQARDSGDRGDLFTGHDYSTTYYYNSLNQVTAHSMPDEDPFNALEVMQSGQGLPAADLSDVQFTGGSTGFVTGRIGTSGVLYYTQDNGVTWSRANALGVETIFDVQFLLTSFAIASADHGKVIRSTNGGSSWQVQQTPGRNNLTEVHFFDSNTGYAAEEDGMLWFTANGGSQWSPNHALLRVLRGNLTALSFSSRNNGAATSEDNGRGYIYTTHDGGTTWQERIGIRVPGLTAVDIVSENAAFTAGNNGVVLRSTNAGETWHLEDTRNINGILRQLHFSSTSNGLILTESRQLMLTRNGGRTWQTTRSDVLAMGFYDLTTGFMLTTGGQIHRTTDGGLSWRYAMDIIGVLVDHISIDAASPYSFYMNQRAPGMELIRRYNTDTRDTEFIGYGRPGEAFREFTFTSGEGVVLSDAGTLYHAVIPPGPSYMTSNNFTAKSLGGLDVMHMSFPEPSTGYAFNIIGAIYKTTNGGRNWTPLNNSFVTSGIDFLNAETGYAITSEGEIYRTEDGGVSWTQQTNSVLPGSFYSLSTPSNTAYYAGSENGDIFFSSNTGLSWVKQNTTITSRIVGIDGPDATRQVAVSEGGQTMSLRPLGWTAGGTLNAQTVSYPGTDRVFAANSGGSIFRSINPSNGLTWAAQPSGTSESLNAIDFVNTSQGIAAGRQGTIVFTTNGGATWQNSGLINPPSLNAGHSVGQTAYVVGNSASVMKSADGGISWSGLTIPGSTADLHDVFFITEDQGRVVGSNGAIWFTGNGGAGWSTETSGTSQTLNAICFSGNTGIIAANAGVIRRRSGTAWVAAPSGVTQNLRDVYLVNGDLGFIVGDQGTILRTDNGGISWTPLAFNGTNWPQHLLGSTRNLTSVYFADAFRGYVTGASGTVLKTEDGGTTWTVENVSTTAGLSAVTPNPDGNLVLAGAGGYTANVSDVTNTKMTRRFWYDFKGRIVLSQDSRQHNNLLIPAYSYIIYDAQGRVQETGEIETTSSVNTYAEGNFIEQVQLTAFLQTGSKREITRTFYEEQEFFVHNYPQRNLRGRIATIAFYDEEHEAYDHATHYSYDEHGNVELAIQENPSLAHIGQQYKTTRYKYDLVSGKVNKIIYQEDKGDQFIHRYHYDGDNRLVSVATSRDGLIWDNDASYFYYDHGPLSRKELGDMKVQGVDYAYTIQGWMKGKNSNTLRAHRDMGRDGAAGVNRFVGQDACGYSLGYFDGDYMPVGAMSQEERFEASTQGSGLAARGGDLYNGNISHMVTAVRDFMQGGSMAPQGMAYRYDQLNRIVSSESFNSIDMAGNQWTADGTNGLYSESLTYDANGNIERLQRRANGQQMDDLQYTYAGVNDPERRNTNRLTRVQDVADAATDLGDIKAGQAEHNYRYDGSGNLAADAQEQIREIRWTAYGKVKEVIREAESTHPDLEFAYDAGQNRIMKIVKPKDGAGNLRPQEDWEYTYYVLDANGMVMAIYEGRKQNLGSNRFRETFTRTEAPVYGSSREGMYTQPQIIAVAEYTAHYQGATLVPEGEVDLETDTLGREAEHVAGTRYYELSNHLGNILAVVSDRKVSANPAADGYQADVVSATDYYPFGMPMPGRNVNGTEYRYGFNGKEKDGEVTGDHGSHLDFGARIYDARLGRWLSVDPMSAKYPYLSPYHFSGNNPVLNIDSDGNDFNVYVNHTTKEIIVKATMYTLKSEKIKKKPYEILMPLKDLNTAHDAANRWNEESGKWIYVVPGSKKRAKSEIYRINFEIDVKEFDSEMERDIAFQNDNSGQANIFKLASNKELKNDNGGTSMSKIGGGGWDEILVNRNKNLKERNTAAHELGHALGLGHFNTGLMMEGDVRREPDVGISQGMISTILKNVNLGVLHRTDKDREENHESESHFNVIPVGAEPKKFNKGIVIPFSHQLLPNNGSR